MGEGRQLLDGARPLGLWNRELLAQLDWRVVDGEADGNDGGLLLGSVPCTRARKLLSAGRRGDGLAACCWVAHARMRSLCAACWSRVCTYTGARAQDQPCPLLWCGAEQEQKPCLCCPALTCHPTRQCSPFYTDWKAIAPGWRNPADATWHRMLKQSRARLASCKSAGAASNCGIVTTWRMRYQDSGEETRVSLAMHDTEKSSGERCCEIRLPGCTQLSSGSASP